MRGCTRVELELAKVSPTAGSDVCYGLLACIDGKLPVGGGDIILRGGRVCGVVIYPGYEGIDIIVAARRHRGSPRTRVIAAGLVDYRGGHVGVGVVIAIAVCPPVVLRINLGRRGGEA